MNVNTLSVVKFVRLYYIIFRRFLLKFVTLSNASVSGSFQSVSERLKKLYVIPSSR
jgi:hypothetical protein